MNMVSIKEDKREGNRAFFTMEEGVSAFLTVSGKKSGSVPVTVLSIGSDGIGFFGTRYKLPSIDVGDRLTLNNIRLPLPMGTIDQLEVAVKHVNDNDRRLRLAYGCEFLNNPAPDCNRIRELVKSRLNKLGFDA